MRRLLVLVLALASHVAAAQTVRSPDGRLDARLTLNPDGALTLAVDRDGAPFVLPSRLGIVLGDGRRTDRGLRVVGTTQASRDTTWETVWGEQQFVRDHHRELVMSVEGDGRIRMDVTLRVSNDGVAFRYTWPAQPGLGAFEIVEETTEFRFASAPAAWWIPAYGRDHEEYLYRHTPLADADTVHTPLTLEFPGGPVVAVHEAALVDYAAMTLAVTGPASLKADLVPWSTGVRVYAEAPARSPWRVLIVGDTPADLAGSRLVLNLNEPSRIADTRWIRPMKYVGVWWAMHLDLATWATGPRHGATTETTRRTIDFAAERGLGGVLVEGWNRGWDGNWVGPQADFSFTEATPDFDLPGLAAYARSRGVGLIGHHETGGDVPAYEAQLDSAFALYARLGVGAVKTGYVGGGRGMLRTSGPGLAPGDSAFEWHYGQYMVRHHARVVEMAARYGITVDIHEPVKDTGLRRTWPNLMSREGARGQEWNAWGPDGGNPPEHETVLPFTRLLGGPMDFTPGIFDVLLAAGNRPDNRVNTTVAKQLALYVVLYSPLQMAADLPEAYEARPDIFRFIEAVPVDWAETHVLHGAIGDAVVVARKDRHSDEWFLGAVTDEQARALPTRLDFLDAGRSYVADVYRDADDADWQSNPLAVTVETGLVDAATVLPVRLAAGGGQAVRLRPATDADAGQTRLEP